MCAMRGAPGTYQSASNSRSTNQPAYDGGNGAPRPYAERRTTNPGYPQTQQQYAIPPSLYVERRSTNPVSMQQPNQPQYVESDRSNVGYQNARALQAQSTGMYHAKNAGTPSRNVNPALANNPPAPSLSQYATFGKESLFAKKETRAEIDDKPIIDPSAFQYLNLKEKQGQRKPTAQPHKESGIDSRPIINLDAVTQLERRRQQQLEKNNRLRGDDGSGAGIDGRAIVDANAFRHIEAKASRNKGNEQQGQGATGGIDESPITNPDAFKYLEARRERKKAPADGNEPAIDTRPIINPDAFRYLEQRNLPARREENAGVDATPMFNPNAFQYVEKKQVPKAELTESTIDYRPIVNPQAFKWIERKEPQRRVDDGPDVDERSYVSPQAFQYIDRRPGKKSDVCEPEIDTRSFILDRNPHALAHLDRQPPDRPQQPVDSGIDERSYVNPQSFKYLEGMGDDRPSPSIHSSVGPTIDTRSYVNANAFQHLESGQRPRNAAQDAGREGIDERSFVPPTAFRHLEFTGESANRDRIDYSTYGQSDF